MDDPRSPVLQLRSSAGLGGPDRLVVDLAVGLAEGPFPCVVGVLVRARTPEPPLLARARARGLDAFALWDRGPLDARAALRVARRVRRARIALIHAHDPKSHVVGAAAARLAGVPLVATHHGWLSRDRRERIYQRADRLALRRADLRIGVSAVTMDELASLTPRGARAPQHVRNGIDLEALRRAAAGPWPERLQLDADRPLIVGVGRLEPGKGFATLVDAAARVHATRPLSLVVLGDGPERGALRRRARACGLDGAIQLPGELAEVAPVVARADALVLPSNREGLPLALLEAAALGTPRIATPVGDVPTIVAHGESGLLVPVGDVGALAAALRRVLSAPAEAARLAAAARRQVEAEHTHQALAARHAALYGSLAS